MSIGFDMEDLAVQLTKEMSQQSRRPSQGLRRSLRSDAAIRLISIKTTFIAFCGIIREINWFVQNLVYYIISVPFYNNLSFRYIWLFDISIRLPFHRPALTIELSAIYSKFEINELKYNSSMAIY
jgi:hypothetical protein